MCIYVCPLGDGGVCVIFILTYAGVRDMHLAANAGLWVFIGLWGWWRQAPRTEGGWEKGWRKPGSRWRPGWESRTVVGPSDTLSPPASQLVSL